MTHTTTISPFARASGCNVFLAAILTVAAAVRRALAVYRDRREVRCLAELDDHMLKDIGLVRGQVDGALAEPLHRSPSLMLVAVSGRDWPRHAGR